MKRFQWIFVKPSRSDKWNGKYMSTGRIKFTQSFVLMDIPAGKFTILLSSSNNGRKMFVREIKLLFGWSVLISTSKKKGSLPVIKIFWLFKDKIFW